MMPNHRTSFSILVLTVAALSSGIQAADVKLFQKEFEVEKSDLSSTGANTYFILEPGLFAVFEGKDKGENAVLTITVLNETKLVDGVETRVVEEKQTMNGELEEVSRNYFAISKKSGDVYYFGEDTEDYEHGKMSHGKDSWLSGVKGARFGLGLPAKPVKGMRYYQEIAPKVAMDRAEVVSLDEVVKTPAGEFKNCLKTEETTPLEKGTEYKFYAPKIGLVQDDQLKLTKYGRRER